MEKEGRKGGGGGGGEGGGSDSARVLCINRFRALLLLAHTHTQ